MYLGIVKDNRVELEGPASLPEGTLVEVRPREAESTAPTVEDDAAADAILQAEGLLEQETVATRPAHAAFVPVVVQGEPLSKQIIRERR